MAAEHTLSLEVDAKQSGYGEDLEKRSAAHAKMKRKRGGWKTFPFIIGNELCAAAAITGLAANMIVYLITKFNIKSIEATHIINISNGGNDLSPLIGAFLADAYLGRFWAISIGSFLSFSAMITLMLTAMIDSLRPPPCGPQLQALGRCDAPTRKQYAVLFLYFALTIAASAGLRYNSGAFGADQFEKGSAKGMRQIQRYFNWYYCVLFVSIVIASTVIVYIQSSVSWAMGFGLCVLLTGISMLFFFSGTKLYNRVRPEGSPFTGLAQVVVACLRKRNLPLPSNEEELYSGDGVESGLPLTQQLRFLNKAAIKAPEDFSSDGQINQNAWRLSTVDQVEQLKSIIKTLTIWSCTVIPAIMSSQQVTFSVLQALTMDRHLGSHDFKIPAASYMVFNLLASAITLSIYDKVIVRMAESKGIKITQLRRIGTGMVIGTVGMAVAAIVERKRLNAVHGHPVVEESALWLVPQHVIIGFGDAFLSVGKIDFFYTEFPETLRSTATALVAAGLAVGSYLSSLLISAIHKNSNWLANNTNEGRLDYFYTLLCLMGLVNFGYFSACAHWYKYKTKIYGSREFTTS
ncbi:protein NRT1/ PTR FAMILY 3.1 [Cryptomeria japonica]|uniref:protein NRT1/ PTR FAMILY 3.1 n=1 Tax=Cryptomeria japonica TaxID=3369 RepID=UPI0027DA8127|nr:protein NRT1/ PTR FAMILY 3.1 [Cryptomeria japonica]